MTIANPHVSTYLFGRVFPALFFYAKLITFKKQYRLSNQMKGVELVLNIKPIRLKQYIMFKMQTQVIDHQI